MIHRLKSRLWVEALLRRCQGEGKFGAVVKTGADDAGAVYVCINHLNGTYDLLEPPPGSSHDDKGGRLLSKVFVAPVAWSEASAIVERRRKSDPDIWLVEIEDRDGLAGLKLIDAS